MALQIGTIIKELFTGGVTDLVDEVITNKEEAQTLKNELYKLQSEHEARMYEAEVDDRKSARTMYSTDADIQKILAGLFTTAYFGLTYIMFRYFVTNDIDLSDYEIGFISTGFGAMSSKVNTIIDFFFGGSSKQSK